MSARLLHAAYIAPIGRTRCKTFETRCGYFRRSVAATTTVEDVTCDKCILAIGRTGLRRLSSSDVMAVCGPGSTGVDKRDEYCRCGHERQWHGDGRRCEASGEDCDCGRFALASIEGGGR